MHRDIVRRVSEKARQTPRRYRSLGGGEVASSMMVAEPRRSWRRRRWLGPLPAAWMFRTGTGQNRGKFFGGGGDRSSSGWPAGTATLLGGAERALRAERKPVGKAAVVEEELMRTTAGRPATRQRVQMLPYGSRSHAAPSREKNLHRLIADMSHSGEGGAS